MENEERFKNIVESMKMDAYIEARIPDMHVCSICGRIGYKNLPMRRIGNKWICVDCLRELKETLDSLDEWEQEIALRGELKKDINRSFNP